MCDWILVGSGLSEICRNSIGLNTKEYVDDYSTFVPADVGLEVADLLKYLLYSLDLKWSPDEFKRGNQVEILGLIFDLTKA